MELCTDRSAISASLICQSTHKSYKLPLSNSTAKWTVGRHPENHLVIQRPEISKRHCYFTFRSGKGYEFVDTSSTGSRINGNVAYRKKKYIVRLGDHITLGGVAKFRFHQVEPNIWSIYYCEKELGAGSFGSVYRCFERTSKKHYAIKVIARKRCHLVRRAEKMFAQEIEILKTLNSKHEHVVQLEEIFEGSSMLCKSSPKLLHLTNHHHIDLVLEYVSGGDLARYMHERAPLSEEETRHFIMQICHGVAFIHDQGVAHRDLKPENILLTTDNPPNVKVADFGLSKLMNAQTILTTQCGTPYYAAPEVIRPSPLGYSMKVDSWSIGVIAFCMLTKHFPFYWPGEAPQEVTDRWDYLSKRIISLEPLYQQTCGAQCIDFVESLLKDNPDERMAITVAHEHAWLDNAEKSALPFEDALAILPEGSQYSKRAGSVSTRAVCGSVSLRDSWLRSGRTRQGSSKQSIPMMPGGLRSSWLRSGKERPET